MKWTSDELEQVLKDNPDLHADGEAPRCFEQVSPAGKNANKYHAQRTEHAGIVYHSKKEAAKAAELDLMVQAGEIDFYLRQVPFVVGTDPLTTYRADFVTFKTYTNAFDAGKWTIEVIETKGYYAPGAKKKLKLFKQKFPALKLVVE
ncbi:MAG: DUF1064 domain-containing protein [Dehalococcoidia bacterium]|jgi:hypothetical protein